MADYGIKVSLPGYGVGTASVRNLSMVSSTNMFKVNASGIGTVNAGASGTVTHNLGYEPNFMVFMANLSDANRMDLVTSALIANKARAYAGTANLVIKNTDISTNRKYYYYIMYDPM